MKGISFFKKVKFFLFYRKTVNKIKLDLEKQFNIRVDEAYRMYTVVNINPDLSLFENYGLEELKMSNQNYDLLPSQVEDKYIDNLYQKTMKEFSGLISDYLNNNGLSELYVFYQIEKITKYSYLVVLGFSLFQTDIYIKNMIQGLRILLGTIMGLFLMKLFVNWLNSPF